MYVDTWLLLLRGAVTGVFGSAEEATQAMDDVLAYLGATPSESLGFEVIRDDLGFSW